MALFNNYDLVIPSSLAFAACYKGIYISTAADVLEACQLATGDNELADAVKAALHSQQLAMEAANKDKAIAEQEVTAAYANAEHYAACLQDVQASLEEVIDTILDGKRLNKAKLIKTLQQVAETANNAL